MNYAIQNSGFMIIYGLSLSLSLSLSLYIYIYIYIYWTYVEYLLFI